MGEAVFIVEHLEPVLSTWMLLEYRHASMILGRGRLVFTNIGREEWREVLRPLGRVIGESVAEAYGKARLLVLDPDASKPLEPRDFEGIDAVVVGGIMGDHPPRHRTRAMLTRRLRCPEARSLGDKQLSIDGAIYVAYRVMMGERLSNIPLVSGVEVKLSPLPGVEASLRLPYAYPLVGGRPLLTPGLVEYLRGRAVYDEHVLLEEY